MNSSRSPRRHRVPRFGDCTPRAAVELDDLSTDSDVDEDARALAEAESRWPAARELLLTVGGPPLSSPEVSALLGIDDRAVEIARQQRRIIGVPDGTGSLVYPRWQFGADGPLP